MSGREPGGAQRQGVTRGRAAFFVAAIVLVVSLGASRTAFSQQTSDDKKKTDTGLLSVLDPFTMQLMTISKATKTQGQRIAVATNVRKERTGGSPKVEIPRNPSARSPFVPPSWVSASKYPNKPGWFDPGWLP